MDAPDAGTQLVALGVKSPVKQHVKGSLHSAPPKKVVFSTVEQVNN